jgi:hypothetical protein
MNSRVFVSFSRRTVLHEVSCLSYMHGMQENVFQTSRNIVIRDQFNNLQECGRIYL